MATERMSADAALREVLRALPEIAAGLKRPGVPAPLTPLFNFGPRHLPVLTHLLLDGPMSVGELAEHLGLALPTTSLMVRDLSSVGLVERTEDPDDRRRRIIGINPEHLPTVRDWLDTRADPVRAALNRLSPAERRALAKGMRILAEEFTRQGTDQP